MSFINRQLIELTTAVGGAATGYTAVVQGLIEKIEYVPDGTAPYDTGVDATFTEEDTGAPILTWTNVGTVQARKYPRDPTHDNIGAASLYAAAGEPVESRIPVSGRIKLVLAQGADAKVGKFYIYLS